MISIRFSIETRIPCWHDKFGLWSKRVHGIKSAAMIGMCVGRENTHDRQAKLLRGLDNRTGTALQCRVDQGKTVRLAHQIDIHEAIIRQLNEMLSVILYFHAVHPFLSFLLDI